MQVRLDYGTTGLIIDVPQERTTVITPAFDPPLADPAAALRDALAAPCAGPPLKALVATGQQVAISVCDITRAQPRPLMLRAIVEALPHVRPSDITVLIATGTHRPNTPDELATMLGPDILASGCRVINHDCRADADLVGLGETSTAVPIRLNRAWVEAAVRITTGFVEPHFFAGFSGGPKLVAPGLAGLDTVLALHDARRIADPRATWGVIEGNPIHDDVREIARRTGVHFALDVTLDPAKRITGVYAGELFAAHAAGCAAARRAAMRQVPAPFEVVVTSNSGYPLDQNLYQAVKGMSAAAQIVRPGGTILCAAECRDGLPDHGPYARLLRERPNPASLLAMITAPGYAAPDAWQVQVQAQIQQRAHVRVTSGLSEAAVRAAHFTPAPDPSAAIAEALAEAGPSATVCVLPHGPQTIPWLG